ncbi:MAG: hypothetical protein IPH42_04425 [Bacteroidetes bacterium]|nr:hypothetical protein [Bacteroidota bacterium]
MLKNRWKQFPLKCFLLFWKQYADKIRKDHHRVAIIMDHAEVTINESNAI